MYEDMLLRVAILSILLLTMWSPSFAGSPLLLVTNTFPPLVFDNPDKPGTMVEVVQAAFKAVDVKTQVRFYPWRRCTDMIKTGEAFGTLPYIKTKARHEFAYFSAPLREERSVFFFLKKNTDLKDTASFEQLKAYKVGGTRGYHYEKIFAKNNLNMDYSSNDESAFRKLLAGRVDFVATGEENGRYLAHKLFSDKDTEVDYTDWAWLTTTGHMMVSKNHPDSKALLERFNEGLALIRANGTYNQILGKYGLTPRSK